MKKKEWICGIGLVLFLFACKQEENKYNATDPRLQNRPFCNDPEAVNYNWDFPGKADPSVCFFPSDLFRGRFVFRDSVYDNDGYADSAAWREYTIHIIPQGKNALRIEGFCATALTLTAPRVGFRATLDTNAVSGQIFCRPQDTVSGFLLRNYADSTHLQIQFSVRSDTSIRTHRGTAYRQP